MLAERNQTNVDPLNLAQWQFYVLPTGVLNDRARLQKTISLSSFLRMGALIAGYQELRDAVERASIDLPRAECK